MNSRAFLALLATLCPAALGPAREEPRVYTTLTGTVRDPDGRPIAGATVRLRSTEGYVEYRAGTKARGQGKTDAAGKYELFVLTKPDARIVVKGVTAEARGFIRFDEDFFYRPPILLPGKSTELNFVLARGEVLAGTAEEPLLRYERRAGVKRADQQPRFRVRGPSFKQVFWTEKGGGFEVWVPRGTYTLELIRRDGNQPPTRLENVASGSRGLRLAVVDPVVPEEMLARAFDALWEDMDRHYSYFTLKKVDWRAQKERFRPKAVRGRTVRKFVEVLEEMLATLQDAHVWLEWPEEKVFPYVSPRRPSNYSHRPANLDGLTWCGNYFAAVGKTRGDGFAAFIMTHQSRADAASVRQVVEFIHSMKDAPGFLIDLRDADGGDERLAREIARQFCGKDTVYARSKYRNGPAHTDFATYDRVLKASAKPFLKPVVCLIGPRCVSSGEGFAQMMKCLPHVTTVGTRTRGSSGNPQPFKLPGVPVTVRYSRWVDLMPDGTAIEGTGIAPDLELNFPAAAYAGRDPTWEKALEVLRKKVADTRK